MPLLSRTDLLRGLKLIDTRARDAGVVVDMSIYGGAVLALAYDIREATRDIDAIFEGQREFVRTALSEIAEQEGWEHDWLNDGVKGWISNNEDMEAFREFPDAIGGGLVVQMPTARYLFAMKCMAMRGDSPHDARDIEALAPHAKVETVEDALALVESFYPKGQISAKVQFGVEEIMERVQANRASPENTAEQAPAPRSAGR